MNHPICPYCGNELTKGYIQSPRPISWLPKKRRLFTYSGFTSGDAQVLSEGDGLSAPCVTAYNCAGCKKIIIDYGNTPPS